MLLIAYLVFSYLIGDIFTREWLAKTNFVNQLSLNLISGFSLNVLLIHLLSYWTQSFRISFFYSLGLLITILAISMFSRFKHKIACLNIAELKLIDIVTFLLATCFGLSMGIRDVRFGSPDNGHLAFANSIYLNDIYPPIFPTAPDLSMDYYHYGVDIISCIIRYTTGLNIWDTLSLQIGIGTFLCFTSLFALFNKFTPKRSWCLILTLTAFFYTSINSLEFFIREIPRLGNVDAISYFKNWLLISWTSVSHLTSQLRLCGQNFGLLLMFAVFYLIFEYLDKSMNKNILLLLCLAFNSFLLYFAYITYWYPIFAALLLYLILKLINSAIKKQKLKEQIVSSVLLVIAMLAGKYLCFASSHTSFDGINAMIFSPSLKWIHWGKAYINYFYNVSYLSQLKPSLDHMTYGNLLEIPLFSSISFREFGLMTFATIFFLLKKLYQCIKTKTIEIESYYLLAFAGAASFFVPFIFEFILRPVETARFLLCAKLCFSFFVLIALYQPLLKVKKQYLLAMIPILLIMLAPGVIAILPDTRLSILSIRASSLDDKFLIAELEKVHKSGDIILDSHDLSMACDVSSIAGFFGVGGQFFKYDRVTRETGIYLLNPKLLKELNVDYVLISKASQISDIGRTRLQDTNLFELVFSLDNTALGYQLYKFKDGDYSAYPQDYAWILGYQKGMSNSLNIFSSGNGKAIQTMTKAEILPIKKQAKEVLLKNGNVIFAVWIKEQAVPLS